MYKNIIVVGGADADKCSRFPFLIVVVERFFPPRYACIILIQGKKKTLERNRTLGFNYSKTASQTSRW